MSAGTKTLSGIFVLALGLGVVTYIEQNPNWATTTDTRDGRTVILVGKVYMGLATVHFSAGSGMKIEHFGTKSNPRDPRNDRVGTWARTIFDVKPGTQIRVIVAADDVTAAHCGISGPGIENAPPAITPLDYVSSTVECSATVK